jgi:aryl-alcohol dehydrogenase-like predicted oxidoreductase
VKEFAAIAAQRGCTPSQLALAWVLSQGEDIIPIPGTKQQKYLVENAGAVEIALTESERQEIEQLITRYPLVGNRYSEGALKLVNH